MGDTVSGTDTLLVVDGVTSSYGRNEAIHEVTLSVSAGEVVTLLGHNGAGKSTTLHCIAGIQPTSTGRILIGGQDVTGHRAARGVDLGIGLVPEQDFVFAGLTVQENVELAGLRVDQDEFRARRAHMFERYPVLADRRSQPAEALSGGEQRMLSMAMAMVTAPRVLLLDEPSLGIAPFLVEQMMDDVRDIADSTGVGVLLVEQNVTEALRVADRAYVMRSGHVIEEQQAAVLAGRDRLWELF